MVMLIQHNHSAKTFPIYKDMLNISSGRLSQITCNASSSSVRESIKRKFFLSETTQLLMKKRDANTARAGCSKVRTPPARPLHTHRQDQLQYTAPQLASAQCNHKY